MSVSDATIPLYIHLSQQGKSVSCKTNRIMYGGSIDVPFKIQASQLARVGGVSAVISRLTAKELIYQSPTKQTHRRIIFTGGQRLFF
jgi:hypothetical protein